MYERSKMYPYFAMLFGVGLLFLFLAVCFLPTILLTPRKCANLVNVGSIFILAAFSALNGPKEFLIDQLLCSKTKALPSILYLSSLLATIYASMILKSYLLTVAFMLLELLCLLYFICSYFPGGKTGFKYMVKFLCGLIKKAAGYWANSYEQIIYHFLIN